MAAKDQKVYKWGIIGCGRISSDFCNVLSVYGRAEIVACAARKVVSARDFARKYDIDSYYDDYEQLAKDDRVDIVYIGTIHPVHVSNVTQCLENGKHVVCEKPMGVNYSETLSMIDCGALTVYFTPFPLSKSALSFESEFVITARRNRRFLLEGMSLVRCPLDRWISQLFFLRNMDSILSCDPTMQNVDGKRTYWKCDGIAL